MRRVFLYHSRVDGVPFSSWYTVSHFPIYLSSHASRIKPVVFCNQSRCIFDAQLIPHTSLSYQETT